LRRRDRRRPWPRSLPRAARPAAGRLTPPKKPSKPNNRKRSGVAAVRRRLVVAFALLGTTAAAANVTIHTRSYDEGRTGWNRSETALKPSNVTPTTFHKIGELRVDDKVEASPLYVAGVTTRSGVLDLVIVATTNNSVYAF